MNSIVLRFSELNQTPLMRRTLPAAVGGLLTIVVLFAVFTLEQRKIGLAASEVMVGETPVTIYREITPNPLPVVVVAHGFGGSRQMMDQIAVTLARAGYHVASFDFPGHGRNRSLMSTDVTRIEGTTAQLVAATLEVTSAMQARADTAGPVSFVGHSMATDVVVRAAAELADVGAVAAISMYSDAVSATHPERFLVVSGEREERLRMVALEALHQVVPGAEEGVTVTNGDVARRVVAAPGVGHVGVLYSQTTLDEISRFFVEMKGVGMPGEYDQTGWVAGLLLISLVILAWPSSLLIPKRVSNLSDDPSPLSFRDFWVAVLLPIPVAILATYIIVVGIFGIAGFASLLAFFASFAATQLFYLKYRGYAIRRPETLATLIYLVLGLLIFGLALDRYGAAFVPDGDRAMLMAFLLIGTVPMMIADATVVAGRAFLWRVSARICVILALMTAMVLQPASLGLSFTVLPVLVLFYLVYGTFAFFVDGRRGFGSVSLGSGIALAWAIAASTPLFAVLA